MPHPKRSSFASLGLMLFVAACDCGAPPNTTDDAGADAGTAVVDAGCGANLATDVNNCGSCGQVCPAPVNATARCRAGVCARGPCNAGFFDLDDAQTFGCEAACSNKVCRAGTGADIALTNDPVPEAGDTWRTLSSGSSQGGFLQTSTGFTNVSTLGEATPPPGDGAVVTTSPSFRNHGGFNAAFKKQ